MGLIYLFEIKNKLLGNRSGIIAYLPIASIIIMMQSRRGRHHHQYHHPGNRQRRSRGDEGKIIIILLVYSASTFQSLGLNMSRISL